ncbi:hypothetical protein MtrunA17_Chr6g0467731 [Medicago truncatula]|uniref:Uncharacterized protein n=1 Tax=Medicago truncatula TaxID=3880 RepID=A0A396HDG0_MEDTR|nr:hypothetical protein MtrunA17_Chr6g0467731 [Medicago truncatula]
MHCFVEVVELLKYQVREHCVQLFWHLWYYEMSVSHCAPTSWLLGQLQKVNLDRNKVSLRGFPLKQRF